MLGFRFRVSGVLFFVFLFFQSNFYERFLLVLPSLKKGKELDISRVLLSGLKSTLDGDYLSGMSVTRHL